MSDHTSRRSFFSRLTGAAAAFGLGAGTASAQSAAGAGFEATRHPQDEWYDGVPGKHRWFMDTRSPIGAGEAIAYAANVFAAGKNGYGLDDPDSAIVICLRHDATPYAWTDAIWAKYGAPIAAEIKFNDPKTNKAPVINIYNTGGFGDALPNRNIALDALAKRGVHFAVCALATRKHAGLIARATGGTADEIFKELTSSMIPNAHLVAAGVLAVNRSQERGYTLLYVG